MIVPTIVSKKVVFFSVNPIIGRFLNDLLMFKRFPAETSCHIYPISLDLLFKVILEETPVAGSSRFHILDWSTNNFFLTTLLVVIFFC